MRFPLLSSLIVAGTLVGTPAVSQTATTRLAADLARAMAAKGLDTFAAAHPEEQDRFVAIMHIKDVQLLAISSRYSAPALLREKLLKGDHRGVYLDLNSGGTQAGRFFVEDMQANGLRADRAPNTPFDIVTRNMTARTAYDGDWKARKVTEAAYRESFARDDAEYAAMLQILLAALSPTTSH